MEFERIPDDPDLDDTPLVGDDLADGDTPPETDPEQTPADDTPGDAPDKDGSEPDGDDDPNADADGPSAGEETKTLLEDLGLSDRYESEEEALRALSGKEATLTQTQQENAELRRLVTKIYAGEYEPPKPAAAKAAPAEFDAQEFLRKFEENPLDAFKEAADQLGFVSKADLEKESGRIDNVEADTYQRALVTTLGGFDELQDVAKHIEKHGLGEGAVPFKAGQNRMWDAMNRIFIKTPALHKMEMKDAIPLAYDLARTKLAPGSGPSSDPPKDKPESKVSKVPPGKKAAAQTTGPKAPATNSKTPDFNDPSWTAEKIEQFVKKNGGRFPVPS